MPRTYRGLDVNSDHGGRFPWQSKRVKVADGHEIAVVDEGPRDAQLTFLLAHGNPTWGYLYRRFIRQLTAAGHRVIVPDHLGFGRSDKPIDPETYTLERHIGNLETVMAELGAENVVPVVQDWGGPIAMGWATRHPDKVAGVVVLNTWAFVKDGGAKIPWLFRTLLISEAGWNRVVNRNFFVEFILRRVGLSKKLDKTDLNAYRSAHPTPDDRIGIARFPRLIPPKGETSHESYATMEAIDSGLAKLEDRPAVIVWALKDQAFRKAQLKRWQKVFPKAAAPTLLPDANHYLQEDAPDEVLGAISGWAGTLKK